jgi:hypothetical protein
VSNVSGEHPAAQSPFAVLTTAILRRDLTEAQSHALAEIVKELELWSGLEANAPVERPDIQHDALRRTAYSLGLADRALNAYRAELRHLGESSDGPKAL